ncbi:hypothetical protein [Emticicia sp. TH156]|uniref:hypothetical protein n=1 Tax=Emticicia sp. TH156 TaxID=2067454 RepID=UPI000CAF12AB|nr:hypothetical protein [Emticicia sp. TH156]PLK44482.1 hypothetical protein C0V77_11915 [Emticicia sp. TH156]
MIPSLLRSGFIIMVMCLALAGCTTKKDVAPETKGEFVFNNIKYSGACQGIASKTCKGGYDVAVMSTANIVIYNMPTAATGTFNIANGWATNPGCNTYVLVLKENGNQIASINGTLTKTGDNSFILLVNVTEFATASSAATISGSGTYTILK